MLDVEDSASWSADGMFEGLKRECTVREWKTFEGFFVFTCYNTAGASMLTNLAGPFRAPINNQVFLPIGNYT